MDKPNVGPTGPLGSANREFDFYTGPTGPSDNRYKGTVRLRHGYAEWRDGQLFLIDSISEPKRPNIFVRLWKWLSR